jgi:hypothetical protein
MDEILYGDDDFEYDLDSVLFNPVASITSKLGTFKLLRRCTFELIGGFG